jgi:hypothetical protein
MVGALLLQTRRSRVRFPMRSLNFSIYPILPARTIFLGSTQPLTEMSTRNLDESRWINVQCYQFHLKEITESPVTACVYAEKTLVKILLAPFQIAPQ